MTVIRYLSEGFPATLLIALLLIASDRLDGRQSNDVATTGESPIANINTAAAVPESRKAEVIVYGSTPGGCCAAIAALEKGYR